MAEMKKSREGWRRQDVRLRGPQVMELWPAIEGTLTPSKMAALGYFEQKRDMI